ncbi:MAG: Gfo/Idh/MocA family oxidoreductase [Acidobacteriota bacterium]|nr:MAG: Gfo/Idh/MocA family oxidoreductase [Acidobacteriota bacterium]
MNSGDKKRDLSRRDFIRTTGITTAGLAAGSIVTAPAVYADARSYSRILGANDRLNYGFIGVGGMGYKHLTIINEFAPADNLAILGVCDVFDKFRKRAQETAALPDDKAYLDYRKLLEDRDIDVAVIATPDHWHARIAVDAMKAGKHIYVEKPMTRTLDEAFKLYEIAKQTKRWVQVGSHGCSDPKWHKAREIVSEGRLGRMLWAQGSYCRNNKKGEWNYALDPDATEQTVNWKMWQGNASKAPWSPERFFRWRKYWDYANGIIGDLWPHRLHPLMLAMNLNEYPKSVACMGGILCDTDKGRGEPREVADTTLLQVQFPSGPMIFLAGATVNERGVEDIIRGQKADLLFGGGKVQVLPERPFVEEVEPADETPPDSGETHAKHQKNFIESLRADKAPNCDIELAIRVQAVVSMAEESYRRGKMVHFDSIRQRMA